MTQQTETPDRTRILIVGGVAGGASAAAKARRLDERAEIVMFERGEYISFANCGLPYHIGGDIADRRRLLVQTPEAMTQRFNIDVRTRTEVVAIDPQAKTVTVRNLDDPSEHTERYDKLILAPGAEPIRPNLPGIDHERVFTLRNMPDMDAIKKVVDQTGPRRAVVVGAGYIGLEMTEALVQRGVSVTLVELTDQVLGMLDAEMAAPLAQQLTLHGVQLRLGVGVAGFADDGDRLSVKLTDDSAVMCDLAVLGIGVRPEATLAVEAGLDIGPTGGIVTDEHMRTSDPDIYAAGDAVEVRHFVNDAAAVIPLAGPANRQGRTAADNALGRPSVYRKTQGTGVCKVFDLAAAATGLNEKALAKAGIDFEKVYVHPLSHAGYYPGAATMSLKLLFAPEDGKILGAQAVGADGVDKRIDVLAVAMRAGLTVRDLRDLELCYAPPFGSAKDPVNYAGFVASNALDGDVALFQPEHLDSIEADQVILDVRTTPEIEAGAVAGSIHIPIDELRDRLDELPRDKELVVLCRVGLRGYLGCRILSQNGFRCRNVTGGYTTYTAYGANPTNPTGPAADATTSGCCSATKETIMNAPASTPPSSPVVRHIDACGLQCPGPIMQLKTAIEGVADDEAVAIEATDPGFAADIRSWCHSTGHELADLAVEKGRVAATIVKRAAAAATEPTATSGGSSKSKSIVVFSGDFDKAMAAFIIANGAAAMGSEVTMFFTFWGLNVLRRPESVSVPKTLIERMFGWMMPRGADKLTLSKMHMAGMGTAMIKGVMKAKNVTPLPELIQSAKAAGVRLVACTMSMDLMGVKSEELIDGIEEGGVAMYLDNAERGNVNLFI